LSSEFWRNFLPAGKDFTIPALIFLPAGIPFLELPNDDAQSTDFQDLTDFTRAVGEISSDSHPQSRVGRYTTK
jgi:hypothetical protein